MKKTKFLSVLLMALVLSIISVKAKEVSTTDELNECMTSSNESVCKLTADVNITNSIVITSDKTLDLNGKTLELVNCNNSVIEVTGVKLTVDDSIGDGSIKSTGGYGLYALDGGTVVLNNGTIDTLYAGLSGNNTTGDMNFEIHGGTVTTSDGASIYMPGQVNLIMDGGTLNGGINVRMGQIEIKGGTINNTNSANTDTVEEYYNYSGNVWYGDALAITTGSYTSKNIQYGNSLNLKISGGTFNSTMGSALTIYSLGKVDQDINVSITGGNFIGKNESITVRDMTKEDIDSTYKAFSNTINLSVTSGTYNYDVSDYVSKGYSVFKTGEEKYVVAKAVDISKLPEESIYISVGDVYEVPELGDYSYYTSSDEDIASVFGNKITAAKAGRVYIYAYTGERTGAGFEIVVLDKKVDGVTEAASQIFDEIDKVNNGEATTVKGVDKETIEKVTEALNNQKEVTIDVVADEIEEKDLIKEEKDALTKEITDNDNAIYFFNAELVFTDGENVLGNITETLKEVEFTLPLPKDIPAIKDGYKREYFILRLHDGKVDKLDVKVDDETFTFKSNKFSTYVLGYTDKAEKNETPKDEVKTEIEPPKTLDSGISYMIMAIVSLIIVAFTVMYFKKRYN